ncbi:hypothetical protein LJR030_004345 [Rhizobium sp. LjRoot30]|uniref:hypothetical protein n=1 Tax=Rhizobium sp. LjRoot30 TaxID=3342320 RepID=UPI003ED0BEFC
MGLVAWGVVVVLVVVFAFVTTRMTKQTSEDNLHDMGLAIMEFGRAFPNEAIRDLHATKDGNTVFVRLHDNKAGFMRNMRGHYSCHLIEPGMARVRPTASGKGLIVEFTETPVHSGQFEFSSAEDAAEVSLWLLGNLVAMADKIDLARPSAQS